jgi:hypothetical protein
MVLVKILKRKDGSSVIVAILVALIISQPLSQLTGPLAGNIMGLKANQYYGSAPPDSGVSYYIYLVLWAFLQLVVLELLAWVYILLVKSSKKK